jgi:hypothetical protein
MALIKTINEIKAVLPRLVSNLTDTSLLPNFDRAEEKYLVPITGKDLYNDIVTKYNASSLSVTEQKILKQMQLVISAYAFLDEMAFSHSKITDGGIRTLNTTQFQKAVGWEYKELKRSLENTALDGIEVLLQGLIDQNSSLWTNSNQYKEFNSLIIKTGLDFNQYESLYQPLRTYWSIKSVVSDVQENYVRNAIGPDMIDYFISLSAPTDEEKHILKLLKKAIANYTIKHACEKYSARFDSNGFTVVAQRGGDAEGETAGRADGVPVLDIKLKAHERDGNAYLAKALYELNLWYNNTNVPTTFKTAYEAGPLASYKQPQDRDRGNGTRKIFRL